MIKGAERAVSRTDVSPKRLSGPGNTRAASFCAHQATGNSQGARQGFGFRWFG